MATLAREDEAVILASEPRFRLGILDVIPALRQIAWNGERRTLEPRVMQVLVALAHAKGEIVGRDDLILRCWDGRIVGDSSINRVISLLRGLAAETGAFEIETVTKVGYRLAVRDVVSLFPPAAPPARPQILNRRAMIGAGTAVMLAGGGALFWFVPRERANGEARAHYEAGLRTLVANSDNNLQAISYFERAVALDPDMAVAWGELAFARLRSIDGMSETEMDATAARVRSDAGRALRLDPRNRPATLALGYLLPDYRNWLEAEKASRAALERLPGDPQIQGRLAATLFQVGRVRESVTILETLMKCEPLVPARHRLLAYARWYEGDLGRARAGLDRADRLWPLDDYVWMDRFFFLSLSGAAQSALAMTDRPMAFAPTTPLPREVGITCAKALGGNRPLDVQAAVAALIEARAAGRVGSHVSIQFLSAFGAIEPAFAQAYDYFLGPRDKVSGERASLAPMSDRHTHILFSPAAAPMRSDPRFARLTSIIGLDRYWKESGTRPDYLGG